MKDNIGPEQIHAFVDGELDVVQQLGVERAMKDDAHLRAQVDGLRGLQQQVRRDADYHAAPDALRRRVGAMLAADRSTARSPSKASIGDALRRFTGWRPLAAAVAATFALTFGAQLAIQRNAQDTRLADEVVGSHVRSTLGQHLVDVSSADHHLVKPFLSSKLDFSPPVRDSDLGDAVFVGGRVDYLDGRPVAALVYKQGEHLVDTFVWPATGGDRSPSFSAERGFRIAHWSRDGMTFWAVSDVNEAEFVALVKRLAS